MNRFGYIENKTAESIDFNPFVLGDSEKVALTGQCANPYSYFKIQEEFHNGTINLYDQNDAIILSGGFQDIWNYRFANVIKYSGETFKIYDYLSEDALEKIGEDFTLTPKAVDYKKDVNGRLHPKRTFVKGFLTECEYFENAGLAVDPNTGFTGITYENPVLKVEIDYYIGGDGYVSYRDTTRSWVKHNGEYSTDTKMSRKYYSKIEAKEEGKRRRNNIIDQLTLEVGAFVVLTETGTTSVQEAEALALPFLDELDTSIDKYLKGNTEPIINSITSADTSTHYWLDNTVPGSDPAITIQQYLLYTLNNGTLETVGLVN